MTKYINKREQTQKHIMKTMLELARKDGLLNVTTSNIIQEAGINRKTFYRYFDNKSQLITAIENQVLDKIQHAHAKIYKSNNIRKDLLNNNSKSLLKFLNIIGMNRNIINLLMSKHGDSKFNYRLTSVILNMVNNTQHQYFIQLTSKEQSLRLHYFTGAIIGTLKFWLNHYNEYSKKDIIHFIFHMNQYLLKNN